MPFIWGGLLLFSTILMVFGNNTKWLLVFPETLQIPIADYLDAIMLVFVNLFRWLFRFISFVLDWPMRGVQELLSWLPWFTFASLATFIAWQGGGRNTAILTLILLLYIVIVGYWYEGINSLSLVVICIPLAVIIGFVLGVLGYRSPKANAFLQVMLDFMQTIPAFAYLIPILLLFGFGPVVGLIASVIFAAPPMVRNTILGLSRVPPEVRESGTMSGCTPRQRFWWVEVPTAFPQMLVGVNQTTMVALSMVIVAAIIGGFEDIGWEVLGRLRKAQFGQSVLAGMVIVCLAIILDRITLAYAKRQLPTESHSGFRLKQFLMWFVGIALVTYILSLIIDPLRIWPEYLEFYPADGMNELVRIIITNYGGFLEGVKNNMQYFILLPVKLGFTRSIYPITWGFELTPTIIGLYWTIIIAGSILAFVKKNWKLGVAIPFLAGLLYFGITGISWVVYLTVLPLFAYSIGGIRVAIFVTGSLLFLMVAGIWVPALISIYLCSVAVAICLILGGLIGMWASTSDRVSAIVRPINDTLQTLPQFVLLIPAVMFFRIGEFTALMAIVAYAIVPMIRYTEQGLRNVSPTAVEAGITSGCTPSQIFWQIKLKLALPQILVGVNQTTLFGLNMLVIAALVGTTGLGQQIYLALSKVDAGAGIVAGIGMALIAMSADRMMQAYIKATKK